MRRALQSLGTPGHIGLAYDAWAPVEDDGSVSKEKRASWLSGLADIAVSPDYSRTFERWEASFRSPGDRVFKLELASRLLVGHGNTSAIGVGLTVHHTWGVPLIPGSALKGLLAHYVDAVYGPADPRMPPSEQPEAERARVAYQGVTWRDRRSIERGPGEIYRAIFGAPDAFDAGAAAGCVIFHDALHVPTGRSVDKPFATDVLTVHQKEYYNSLGKGDWPNDYDDPNPVAFLTVRPR